MVFLLVVVFCSYENYKKNQMSRELLVIGKMRF